MRITVRFEWDSNKNRINRIKHGGLDFETASRVFDDPNVMLIRDRVIEGEERLACNRSCLDSFAFASACVP